MIHGYYRKPYSQNITQKGKGTYRPLAKFYSGIDLGTDKNRKYLDSFFGSQSHNVSMRLMDLECFTLNPVVQCSVDVVVVEVCKDC